MFNPWASEDTKPMLLDMAHALAFFGFQNKQGYVYVYIYI